MPMHPEIAKAITEAEFQRTVIDMAHALGWLVHHTRPARTGKGWTTPIQGNPGLPDLVMVSLGALPCLVFAELKSERGREAAAQRRWADVLGRLGWPVVVRLWRPSDLPEIEAFLREWGG